MRQGTNPSNLQAYGAVVAPDQRSPYRVAPCCSQDQPQPYGKTRKHKRKHNSHKKGPGHKGSKHDGKASLSSFKNEDAPVPQPAAEVMSSESS